MTRDKCPYCQGQKNSRKLTCSFCFELLPYKWRIAIPKIQQLNNNDWLPRIQRFFNLTQLPMQYNTNKSTLTLKKIPLNQQHLIPFLKFELNLMRVIYESLKDIDDPDQAIEHAENIKELLLTAFQQETHDQMREELT